MLFPKLRFMVCVLLITARALCGQTPRTNNPVPDYSAGVVNGKRVYIAQTHKVTVETNHQYKTSKDDPPLCEYEVKDPQIIQHAGEALAGMIAKAIATGAGVPWAAGFAGPLLGPAGEALKKFVDQSGGDIKKILVQTGLTTESAACKTFMIVVPSGSEIVSVDGFTDRTGSKDGKITKTSNGPTFRCETKPAVNGLQFQACVWSGWKYSESGPVVSAVLMDWSHNENVDGNLKVAFIPPLAWAKKHPWRH